MWLDRLEENPKIEIINNTTIDEIKGDKQVEAVHLSSGDDLPVDGCFIEIGSVPTTSLTEGLQIELDDKGFIKVDSGMRTTVPGIFAAGDVTNVPEKQIIIAAGDGAKAALSAFKYLAKQG